MVTKTHRYRDQLKVVKVIESCLTIEQLKVALQMIREYDITYNTYAEFLYDLHYKYVCKLIEVYGAN